MFENVFILLGKNSKLKTSMRLENSKWKEKPSLPLYPFPTGSLLTSYLLSSVDSFFSVSVLFNLFIGSIWQLFSWNSLVFKRSLFLLEYMKKSTPIKNNTCSRMNFCKVNTSNFSSIYLSISFQESLLHFSLHASISDNSN